VSVWGSWKLEQRNDEAAGRGEGSAGKSTIRERLDIFRLCVSFVLWRRDCVVTMTMGKLMLLEVEPGGEGDHGRSRPGARPSTSTKHQQEAPSPPGP
jgi:hypothetical protein